MIGRRDDAPRGWLQRLRVPRRQGGEDVAALRRQNAALMEEVGELTRQARTDPLTGLANRRGWNEQLSRELAQAQRSGRPVSVALMDIDDFKAFNDSRGHQAGDRLLVAAAAAWQAQLREGDLLCRWGGDEFAALLPDCSEGAAHEIIARVTSTTPGLQSCAAGVVAWDGAETSDELVWRADVELLKQKRARVQSAP
ncbi:MAG TPA: GGDEF domain-containing protein [Thermoleophilaceae bacterium]|jgi:diguanylate cyclase (GGDEF)-like protein|nr:GGDEF domain-containing protein [Thermoleophilaceae bacterium]